MARNDRDASMEFVDDDLFYILHVEDEPSFAHIETLPDGKTVYVGYVKNSVEKALAVYDVVPEQIQWSIARSKKEAFEKIDEAQANPNRKGRGFDAVLCDLKIFEEERKSQNWKHGIDVVRKATSYSWPGAVVVISNFAEEEPVIAYTEAQRSSVDFDDWIDKNIFKLNPALATAKLTRCLIPTQFFARRCREQTPPLIFIHQTMLRLLRQLLFLARKDYPSWPLAKILLLGEPGSGKNMLARTFFGLLPNRDLRILPRPITLNCASAVPDAHGGRITFFGAEGFGNGVTNHPGVFESATYYARRDSNGLAAREKGDCLGTASGGGIDYARAGVVFLDEFAELAPELQASILNALEEGAIRREGTGTEVPIGCHVIFATNDFTAFKTPERRTGARLARKMREDLIDRIPYILQVPSLAERLKTADGESEVVELIKALAAEKLRTYDRDGENSSLPPDITISGSAFRMIKNAITEGVIKSTRQLQACADMLMGEQTITDGNLAPMLAKARILGKLEGVRRPLPESGSFEKAESLGLTKEFMREDLPPKTQEAIELLCKLKQKDRDALVSLVGRLKADRELKISYALFSKLIDAGWHHDLYPNHSRVRNLRQEAYEMLGIEGGEMTKSVIIAYLAMGIMPS